MTQYYVHVAAQAFDATVFDTEDLSTIRGGSHALRNSLKHVRSQLPDKGAKLTDTIFEAASEGVYVVECDLERDKLEHLMLQILRGDAAAGKGTLPAVLPHMVFTAVAVEPTKHDSGLDYLATYAALTRRMVQQRYTQLTVDLPPVPENNATVSSCQYDKKRPAEKKLHNDKPNVSLSVYARHMYGRKQRKALYGDFLDNTSNTDLLDGGGKEKQLMDHVDSLHDLVDAPSIHLPVSLKSKMAVLYLDGNRFTHIRNNDVLKDGGLNAMKDLSKAILAKQKEMIVAMHEHMQLHPEVWMTGPDQTKFRLETLLIGGDEMLFVMPAWGALEMLAVMSEHLTYKFPYTAQGREQTANLSYSAGMTICNYKTPIREAKSLAMRLCEMAKTNSDRKRTSAQYMVLESNDPPTGPLERAWTNIYGPAVKEQLQSLTLAGDETFRCWFENARKLKSSDTAPSAGRMRAMLSHMLKNGGGTDTTDMIKVIKGRPPTESEEGHDEILGGLLTPSGEMDCFLKSKVTPNDPPTFFPLLHLVELWDYIGPYEAHKQEGGPS